VKLDLHILAPAPVREAETRIPLELMDVTIDGRSATFAIFDDPFGYVGFVRVGSPALEFSAGAFGDSPSNIKLAVPVISTVSFCEALQ
jgi:hypothetical protein